MSVDKSVKLMPSSGREHWYARYYDNAGKRRRVIVGRKDELSKRAAQKAVGELAEKLAKEPGRRDLGKSPPLGLWLDEYIAQRTDLSDASMVWQKLVVAKLKESGKTHNDRPIFDGDTLIDRITRAHAAAFRAWVLQLKGRNTGRTIAPYTAKTYMVITREIFNYALAQDKIPYNPFDRIKLPSAENEKEWPYITVDQTMKIIEAAPSHDWKCLIALARLGGLRRGEALRLDWRNVDWNRLVLTIKPPRAKKDSKNRLRTVPIQPKLYDVLRAAWEAAADGAVRVCGMSPNNIEDRVREIVRAAGMTPWADKPLHTLRKNLETDWLAEFPVLDVTGWLGNSPEVAKRHYNQTKDETVARVTGGVSEVDQLRAELAALKAQMGQETQA